MKVQLSHAMRFLMLSATLLVGCRAAHNVAVSSFRVIDAPANYVRRHLDDDEGTTTTTTTTYQSDVVTPGQPVITPPPQRSMATRHRSRPESDEERSEKARDSLEPRSKSAPPQRTASSTANPKIPYAKPVPGKPGYVYSPFDPNGGYVDVTGYAAGSKAKDPYSGKIFIVP